MTIPMDSSGIIPFCIHGLPRSGTTWLGEVFNSHPRVCYKFQPLFSYALKEFITSSSSREQIQEFFDVLLRTQDRFLDQEEERRGQLLPVFEKQPPTHVAYKEVRYHHILPNLLRKHPLPHVFLIVRDPRATICSWWKSPKEFRTDLGWQIEEEWRYAIRKNLNRPEEYNGFERWKEAVRLFVHLAGAYPRRVTLMRYRELLADPAAEAARLFGRVGLDFPEQTRAFLDRSRDPNCSVENRYSVFRPRSRDDEWRDQLPGSIAQEICRELKDTQLNDFLDDQPDRV